MKCSESFLNVYNATFEFIGERYGYEALCEYWEYISKETLGDLKELVEKKGLKGCVQYWEDTLNFEGGSYLIICDDEKFILEINKCPSIGHLKDKAYERYCDHCEVMYKYIFDKQGYNYNISHKKVKCTITISRLSSS